MVILTGKRHFGFGCGFGGYGGFRGYGGFGGCGDWCADGTMSHSCKGGFGPPTGCGDGCCGGCGGLTFPCMFGASVNNPVCECCKEKPPKGMCQWACMWPCCCQCKMPEFKFKPLEPKPVCHSHCHRRGHSHKKYQYVLLYYFSQNAQVINKQNILCYSRALKINKLAMLESRTFAD